MNQRTIKNLTIAVAEVFLLVLLMYVAIYYFRLGWFLILIWPAGYLLALLIVKSLRSEFPAIVGALIILVVYVSFVSIAWMVFFNQKSQQTFQMSWIDKGSDNQFKQPEVVLKFVDYPKHYVGIYSSELADHLRESKANPVPVTLEMSSVFWCVQGHHEVQVGQLTKWESAWSYSGVEGMKADPSPWPHRWWCD